MENCPDVLGYRNLRCNGMLWVKQKKFQLTGWNRSLMQLDTTPAELLEWESDTGNSLYGNHVQNLLYFEKNQELLDLYKEIYDNQTLALLFDKTRDLDPSDLEGFNDYQRHS